MNPNIFSSCDDMRLSMLRRLVGEKTIKSMQEQQEAFDHYFMIDLRAELESELMFTFKYDRTMVQIFQQFDSRRIR